ncbi:hypothetical protein RND81_04G083600 [Saponaria officinalis]|uniref:Secreted protein n=1 Tax=Saponaria officinalis TaxID=3572 RepID=A0AAW1LK10_SAPOF
MRGVKLWWCMCMMGLHLVRNLIREREIVEYLMEERGIFLNNLLYFFRLFAPNSLAKKKASTRVKRDRNLLSVREKIVRINFNFKTPIRSAK